MMGPGAGNLLRYTIAGSGRMILSPGRVSPRHYTWIAWRLRQRARAETQARAQCKPLAGPVLPALLAWLGWALSRAAAPGSGGFW